MKKLISLTFLIAVLGLGFASIAEEKTKAKEVQTKNSKKIQILLNNGDNQKYCSKQCSKKEYKQNQ
ncbi:MAG: hypothetical protein ACP5F8_03570 [Candidatus Aenigmatarchaeota archaeon]